MDNSTNAQAQGKDSERDTSKDGYGKKMQEKIAARKEKSYPKK